MILKVERYVEQDWWMLDDIRKVSKQKFEQHFNKDFESDRCDIFILDFEQYIKNNPESYANHEKLPNKRDVVILVCRLSNGDEFSIIFDTIAYLCNDEGKTIEIIVANYKD